MLQQAIFLFYSGRYPHVLPFTNDVNSSYCCWRILRKYSHTVSIRKWNCSGHHKSKLYRNHTSQYSFGFPRPQTGQLLPDAIARWCNFEMCPYHIFLPFRICLQSSASRFCTGQTKNYNNFWKSLRLVRLSKNKGKSCFTKIGHDLRIRSMLALWLNSLKKASPYNQENVLLCTMPNDMYWFTKECGLMYTCRL